MRSGKASISAKVNAQSLIRLGVAWLTVAAFLFGPSLAEEQLHQSLRGALVSAWLLGTIAWCTFGVVHEAENLARSLGEPFGTLVLTLSIVIIEVTLVGAVMLNGSQVPTLGRDTMFAVLMIVLNGIVGLALLIGGLRHHQQSFNLQGASSYLALLMPLSLIALVLPNFTVSAAHGRLSILQSVSFSIFTILLYALFLWLQTGRHRGFFKPLDETDENLSTVPSQTPDVLAPTGMAFVLLPLNILPIVILSKGLARQLDAAIVKLGAPTALAGIIVAAIVLTPEGVSALKAVSTNQLTRGINLCLGAATSTVGLTVPAVLTIGLLTGQVVVLGLSAANMVLLCMTLLLSTLTFSGVRTTMLEGAVHLSLFLVFLVLVISP